MKGMKGMKEVPNSLIPFIPFTPFIPLSSVLPTPDSRYSVKSAVSQRSGRMVRNSIPAPPSARLPAA